jgi:hypothetical protein
VKTTTALLAALNLSFFSAVNINFDSTQPGEPPAGWTSSLTNPGAPPRWIVLHDPNAPSRPNVLAQDSKDAPRFSFPLCLFDKVTCLDGDVSVKLKIISGRDGQDAGVVFRAADANNYYLVRASAREHNIALFRVADAHLVPLPVKGSPAGPVGVLHAIRIGDWNLMRVTYRGDQVTVYFNHRKVFDAIDRWPKTPGRSGLWTKADTVAYFDDFRIDKKR